MQEIMDYTVSLTKYKNGIITIIKERDNHHSSLLDCFTIKIFI